MMLFLKSRDYLSLKILVIPFTTLYQLTKFEAPCYSTFPNSLITIVQCPNSQKAITLKNKITFFKKFHQEMYSPSSISWPILRLLPVIILLDCFITSFHTM